MTVPTNETDILVILTRVETKLDVNIAQGIDHETRLRTVEKRLWQLPSLATLLALVGTGSGLLALLR